VAERDKSRKKKKERMAEQLKEREADLVNT
jgi:hypothetical protein